MNGSRLDNIFVEAGPITPWSLQGVTCTSGKKMVRLD